MSHAPGAMPVDLSEHNFDRLADETLSALIDAVGELDDLDAELSQGVLTLKFDDGRRYVVNSHRAARQIWAAAEASAWHFDWDGAGWVSTRTKEELWGLLEGLLSKKLGRPVRLRS